LAGVNVIPDFHGGDDLAQTSFFVACRLATSTSVYPPPRGAAPPPRSHTQVGEIAVESAWQQRALPQFTYNHDSARDTTVWIAALTDDWISHIRQPMPGVLTSSRPGARLAATVAAFAAAARRTRRAYVRTSPYFALRSRDPPMDWPQRARRTGRQQLSHSLPASRYPSMLTPQRRYAQLVDIDSPATSDDDHSPPTRTRRIRNLHAAHIGRGNDQDLASVRRVRFDRTITIATAVVTSVPATESTVV
jgi:hypothetical protein